METRRGLLTKLGGFTVVAVGLVVLGKQHIASIKDDKHRQESEASVDTDYEFANPSPRPGFPSNNPYLDYENSSRESKYVSSGVAYATRTKGDRLSIWNIFRAKTKRDEE